MAPLARLLSTLLPIAAALKDHAVQDLVENLGNPWAPRYAQKLGNLEDVQYFGDIKIGAQVLNGIMDTGSFELVTFSSNCGTCGAAGRYSPLKSKSYKNGNITQTHSYGSGSCTAHDATDRVSVWQFAAPKQALWIATECNMPLLYQASFNAVVGLGPPEAPEYMAMEVLKHLELEEQNYKSLGLPAPFNLQEEKAQAETDVAAARGKHALLDSLGVSVFSTCLERTPGSPGWLIWNDPTREGWLGVRKLPVRGENTWSFRLHNFSLGSKILGCEEGCAALVDTGTSLFAVDTGLYDSVVETLSVTKTPCTDLKHFPDLTMVIEGQHLRFPPSSYVGSFFGQMSSTSSKFVRRNSSIGKEMMLTAEGTRCEVLMLDLGLPQMTQFGPMLILGMPFFREYYTTFNLGMGRGDRSVFISEADPACNPKAGAASRVSAVKERGSHAYRPRMVDASKVRLSRWADKDAPKKAL